MSIPVFIVLSSPIDDDEISILSHEDTMDGKFFDWLIKEEEEASVTRVVSDPLMARGYNMLSGDNHKQADHPKNAIQARHRRRRSHQTNKNNLSSSDSTNNQRWRSSPSSKGFRRSISTDTVTSRLSDSSLGLSSLPRSSSMLSNSRISNSSGGGCHKQLLHSRRRASDHLMPAVTCRDLVGEGRGNHSGTVTTMAEEEEEEE